MHRKTKIFIMFDMESRLPLDEVFEDVQMEINRKVPLSFSSTVLQRMEEVDVQRVPVDKDKV